MPINNKLATLSKSNFTLASSCVQKLLYNKAGYPCKTDNDEFLQSLAEGGYIVGKMAQVMYEQYAKENGFTCKEISTQNNSGKGIEETWQLLNSYDKIILFEPAIAFQQYIIRIDILIKDGSKFEIIEVKAKSHQSEEDASLQTKKLKEYIEDVAYQTHVFQLYLENHNADFAGASIQSFLFTPDKSKATQIDNLTSWFNISERKKMAISIL